MYFASSVFCLCALLAAAPQAHSQTDLHQVNLMVSRDANGSINKDSKYAIRELSKLARENGHVRIWVTLDTPFNPFLNEISDQEARDQQARLDEMFDGVLIPLLAKKLVRYPTGERVYSGPSIAINATEKGLARLIRDRRVGQLVGVSE